MIYSRLLLLAWLLASSLVAISATNVASSASKLLDSWKAHKSEMAQARDAGRDTSSMNFQLSRGLTSLVRVHQHKVLVRLILAAGHTIDELVSLVNRLHGKVDLIPEGNGPARVLAWLPLDSLEGFARGEYTDLVSHVVPAEPPVRRAGSVSSQVSAGLNLATTVETMGFTGAGQRIGVISDSFDTVPAVAGGLTASITAGDLPATSRINILKDTPSGTDEGRGMAELIFDVAPGVDFLFYGPTSRDDMAAGITALRTVSPTNPNPATIIVDDLFFFSEFIFQDGDIAQAAEASVAAGVPYLSAAGNSADEAFDAQWDPLAVTLTDTATSTATNLFCHQFSAGVTLTSTTASTRLGLYFAQTSPASVNLFMIDVNSATPTQFTMADFQDNVGADPFDIIDIVNDQWGICHLASASPLATGTRIKVLGLDSNGAPVTGATGVTVVGHSTAPNIISVAASPFFRTCRNTLTSLQDCTTAGPQVEDFTSLGGQTIVFDTAGNVLTTPVIRQKPDVAGPDGCDTSFFGSDIADTTNNDLGVPVSVETTNTFPNFFGTSAAAPAVAALVALMKEKNPGLTPAQILSTLTTTATDVRTDFNGRTGITTGFDLWSGFGLVDGAAALGGTTVGSPSATISITPSISGPGVTSTPSQSVAASPCSLLTVDIFCIDLTRAQCGSTGFECCRWLKRQRDNGRRARCGYNCKRWTDENSCSSDINCVWSRKFKNGGDTRNTCRKSRAWKKLNQ